MKTNVSEPSAKCLVQPEYQETEIGQIPSAWSLKPLSDVAEFLDGRRRPVKDVDRAKMRGDIPYYGASGIVDYVSEYLFNEDLILLGEDGENILSRNTRLAFKVSGKSWVNNHAHVLRPRPETELGYLVEFLESLNFEKFNTGTAQPKLNKFVCSGIPICCPPVREQRAIATALSDVDALIAGLERLIAKKRDIKQAAMQQLLTGGTRLPGFIGEWASVQLGNLLNVCHGKNQREVEVPDGPYPILATGGQIGTACQPLHDRPSVLIGRKGTINKPQYMDTPFWTVDTLFYCDVHQPNSAKFLYYRFLLIDWMQYNEASGVPSLNGRTIERVEIVCPHSEEQTAIAAVLSDMDADLSALESRLAKTRAIKQGMMQELLTGRTRLV
jgi:type I restriction enzyme S subunit